MQLEERAWSHSPNNTEGTWIVIEPGGRSQRKHRREVVRTNALSKTSERSHGTLLDLETRIQFRERQEYRKGSNHSQKPGQQGSAKKSLKIIRFTSQLSGYNRVFREKPYDNVLEESLWSILRNVRVYPNLCNKFSGADAGTSGLWEGE